MLYTVRRLTLAAALLAASFAPLQTAASAAQVTSADAALAAQPAADTSADWPTDQIIVQYVSGAGASGAAAAQMQTLSAAAGVTLTYFREMSGEAHVLKLPDRLPIADVQAMADRLSGLPEVVYAEPDRIMRPLAEPDDPRYEDQWHYFPPVAGRYGANLPGAWDLTTGDAGIRVAVLDTGLLLEHPDLAGRTVAGYDFISNTFVANDGNGRDADPADPGDWVAGNICFPGAQASASSWHGTHVAGTIGAASNNAAGVTGINWVSPIQPVRVLGRCGGTTSDIADAIRWAAGLSVSGVPANGTPARVINLSLGGSGSCGTTFQSAINAAAAAGAVVVAAAGNSGQNASDFSPGNCKRVIAVAASNRDGNRAFYSNFGATVAIAAPGGETSPTTADGVLSALNAGTAGPAAHSYAFYQGTSMAAPHVAGIASLVLSANPALGPTQVLQVLRSTVTPFPAGSTCSTATCGAGIVNAAAAVARALATQLVYVPLVARTGSGSAAWTTIVEEGFEGTFPTGLWQVTDPGYEEFYWAKRNCRAYAGSFSAWAMGGGSLGSGLGCSANYINEAFAWMIYGPVSLADATAAELTFRLWQNAEQTYDGTCALASTDAINFYGTCLSGSTGNSWSQRTLNLANVSGLGSLLGQEQVWIAVLFESDESVTYSHGASVDSILVRKCVGGACAAASGAEADAPGIDLSEAPAMRVLAAANTGRD